MKILIGCDVDPSLPPILTSPPNVDIWKPLDSLGELLSARGGQLPPLTWLIRCDESVRFCTGDFASGYLTRQTLWQTLVANGHELGWHVHLTTFDKKRGCFGFDPDPAWLSDAYDALAQHFVLSATRTGWDYASNTLFNRLEKLGIGIDFSALPGNVAWHKVGKERLFVDWSRCPAVPYHPHTHDYQRAGYLRLLEVPIAQFPLSPLGFSTRVGWRLRNRYFRITGLNNKTQKLTDRWSNLPAARSPVWAFYFHPEDLRGRGLDNFLRNIDQLGDLPNAEFVTASRVRQTLSVA